MVDDRNLKNDDNKTKIKKYFIQICKWFIVVLCIGISYIPFWIMLVGSLKSTEQIRDNILMISFPMRYVNYVDAFNVVLEGFLNSFIISLSILVGTLFLSALAAYAFARFTFRFKGVLYMLIIVNMTIPSLLTMVPQYLITTNILHLNNNHLGVIIPGIAGGQIMGIFLTRTFIENLPQDLFDAARIDGAGEFIIFFKITIPLVVPILVTVALMNVLGSWNDIVWPNLILEDESKQTIAIRMLSFNTIFGADLGRMFAAYTLASIPLLILFSFNMKKFMNSIAAGCIKG